MKHRLSSILITAGLLLGIGALGLTGYNLWDDSRADRAMLSALVQVKEVIAEGSPDLEQTPDDNLYPDMNMPTTKANGYRYIGVLTIPALNLELPIMEEWDYKRLKIAPCRYAGSAYQNNLVICAHNYSSHFGTLKNLQNGDEVFFTDVDGNVFHYAVAQLETLVPAAIEEMKSEDWALTLFTCTRDGRTRVTVRCEADESL